VAAGALRVNPFVSRVGFIPPGVAGRLSARLTTGAADVGVRVKTFLAASLRILWATATGVTPGGADAAAFVAFPANRTNCLYLSNSCRHFFRSGSATDIPATFALRA
jgi:hypothetical protein